MAKVLAGSYNPGDYVLFKRGETWTGTRLDITWNGAAGKPITFGAWGSGNRPVIDGNDAVHCVQINGKGYIRLENLDLKQGVGNGLYAHDGAHHIDVVNCDSSDCGNDGLLFIDGCHDCNVIGGRFYANFNSGSYQVSGIEVADSSYNITIDGAECDNNLDNAYGIVVLSHNTPPDKFPVNVVIKNCNIHDNPNGAIRISRGDSEDPLMEGTNVVGGGGNTIVGDIDIIGDVTVTGLP